VKEIDKPLIIDGDGLHCGCPKYSDTNWEKIKQKIKKKKKKKKIKKKKIKKKKKKKKIKKKKHIQKKTRQRPLSPHMRKCHGYRND